MDAATIQFVVISLIKILAIIFAALLPIVSYTVYAERRVSAMIQDRLGPNRVGPQGLLQPIADAMKFLLKEDFTPGHVNKFYYWLAPALAMIPAITMIAVIPFGSTLELGWLLTPLANATGWDLDTSPIPMVIADVDIGVLFIFAVSSLGVYGIVLGGWASNSKYPFLGGVRSSAQMISYELALGLSVVPVFLFMGTLNLSDIVNFQWQQGWLVLPLWGDEVGSIKRWLLTIPMLISFVIFTVAIFAETNRLPFDLPESETELVGGYHTEYSSMKFALYFLGEYAAMITGSAAIVTLFLGGWSLPGIPSGDSGFFWGVVNILTFFVKLICLLFLFIWVRWTLPRFRYDQLMKLGWVWFFEIALVNIIVTAIILALPIS